MAEDPGCERFDHGDQSARPDVFKSRGDADICRVMGGPRPLGGVVPDDPPVAPQPNQP